MRVIVAGDRHYTNYKYVKHILDTSPFRREMAEIVSGGATGVDSLGEKYAEENDLTITVFPARWDKYGRAAGPIRNEEMAQHADALVAFLKPGSKGTKNMIEVAAKYKLPTEIIHLEEVVS